MGDDGATGSSAADAAGPSSAYVSDGTWTQEALADYRRRAQELIAAVTAHVDLTARRGGRQRELPAYFASAEGVRRAVDAFTEAEFAWCGSFPVRAGGGGEEDEEFDEEFDEGPVADPSVAEAPVLSVLARWDYVVTDVEALLRRGREGYLTAWPQDTEDDAVVRVHDPESAVREILHGPQLPVLDDTPGLEPAASFLEVVRHAREDEEAVWEDPFGVLGEEQR
ncbi:hypothetical protein [Kineococcus terrestris]|uniref:hypothetical protein n=1 Tax=Kineococcus terrestris TaxID=2044856 RepID=UPI0034DB404A